MVVTAAVALVLMLTSGVALSNYAWREAQWQELQAVTRAAVSAAGPMLARAGSVVGNQEISERVAKFMSGLMPGLSVDASKITIDRDADEVISVAVRARYAFQDIFGYSGGGDAETVTTAVRVKLEVNRYEVAVATDISHSMLSTLSAQKTKLQALKDAFAAAIAAMKVQAANNPGSMMVSVVRLPVP